MSGPSYSRVYWTVMDDPKFDDIRDDMRHLGTWTLLLIVADMAWPAPAFLPPVPKPSVVALESAGIIDLLPGHRYRIHGLDAERGRRSDAARQAADMRWQSERSADAMQTHNGRNADRNAEPMLDETRLEETRRDKGIQGDIGVTRTRPRSDVYPS